MRKKIEECLNADGVLVASSPSSRCYNLRMLIERRFTENADSGDDPAEMEHLGRTLLVGGLELYVDGHGDIWAGDETWVVPVSDS